ncbi:MAG: right-handed parallel beta-helix repeat-containing protein, partial [Bacteroidota bacterium]
MSNGTRTDGGPVQGPAVSAAVTFTVSAGTYNERVQIPAITGADATKTITFDGVDPSTRTLTWSSTSINDYTLQLNGADFIRIHNLGIENTGTTYGYGVHMINQANNNEIKGCEIDLSTTTTSTYSVAVLQGPTYSTFALSGSDNTIEDNTITGGRFGIAATGPSGTQSTGLNIINNTILESYYCAIYLYYINMPVVQENEIQMRQQYTFAYGVQFRYCSRFDCSYNKVQRCGAYGIYSWNGNFNTNDHASIYNNWVGGDFQTTGTSYGIYLSSSRYVRVAHNSVLMDNPGSGGRALYITGSANVGHEIMNNSFAVDVNGTSTYGCYIISGNYISQMDYNNFYTNGTTLAYFQGAYNTLAALQTGQPAYNQNSQEGWPNYFSSTDLHTFGPALNNWATNLAWVTDDIDGQTRPLAPDVIKDVGADEHVLPPFDADIWDVVSPTVLGIGNNNVTVQIQNNGNNSLNGMPLTLQYSTDGGTTWPVTQVFTPTTLGTSGGQENFTFTTPWNVATSGSYTLCVRINPQITGDPDASDEVCQGVCTGMGGNYTINGALPTGGTNFNSFSDAAAALTACGVNAPVYIDVTAGTYTENFVIGQILGASATNTITFDGGDAANTTISFNLTTTNTAIVRLDGADHVTFKHITVNVPGQYGYGFHLKSSANYNTIDSCVITMPNNSLTSYHIGVLLADAFYYSYGDNANYTTISNNVISGGYYGVRMNGISSSGYTTGNRILNNDISDFYYTGCYSIYQQDPHFINNHIRGRTQGTFSVSGYGIYSYYSARNFRMEYNRIYNTGARALYCGYG